MTDSKPNIIDKAISIISPTWAHRRQRARAIMALENAYVGAMANRRSLISWITSSSDADTDIIRDLPTLRARSRDLDRNNPLAHGVLKTKCLNVIGPGLKLRARLDRDALGMSDEEADAWERAVQREWKLFWETPEVDITRTCTGPELEWMVYKQVKLNGEVLVYLPRVDRGTPYSTKIQVIEADRLCNKDGVADTPELIGGVRKDAYGAPVEYHILRQHPGSRYGNLRREWDILPAYNEAGLRNVLHIYRQERPGQTRGVPDFAPIIEAIKQLGRYTEAELDATVLNAFLTVFIKTENPGGVFGAPTERSPDSTTAGDIKLGKGTIVELSPGEDISTVAPGRPNQNFDPFFQAIVQQISVALGLPHEVVMKRFLASYSAARAALLDAWKYFIAEREWIALKFHQPIYEAFLFEAIALGRLPAPGYFADPIIRMAYNGADWIGPAKGMINEADEVEAAAKRLELGLTTLDEETAQITGGDWEQKHSQRVKEKRLRVRDGLEASVAPASEKLKNREKIDETDTAEEDEKK